MIGSHGKIQEYFLNVISWNYFFIVPWKKTVTCNFGLVSVPCFCTQQYYKEKEIENWWLHMRPWKWFCQSFWLFGQKILWPVVKRVSFVRCSGDEWNWLIQSKVEQPNLSVSPVIGCLNGDHCTSLLMMQEVKLRIARISAGPNIWHNTADRTIDFVIQLVSHSNNSKT